MTGVCFFRYAWIAPDRFAALLPGSAAAERLSAHLSRGAALAAALPERALRSGAIARLHAFAARPALHDLPPASLIRSATHWATGQDEAAAAQLAGWCATLCDRIGACTDGDGDDDRDALFLARLAQTDFPVLLLWSNPDLARHLFVCGAGGVEPAPLLATNPKARRKATTAALRYALGTFGRFGPRGGWIGSGFAIVGGAGGASRIAAGDEELRIEPDIGWAARAWFPDVPGDILPGDDAWGYLRRKLDETGAAAARRSALERLRVEAERLAGRVWSFADVDAFLRDTAARLARTVDAARWRDDPHRWWVSRVLTRELRVRADFPDDCDRLYAAARAEFVRAAPAANRPAPADGPFPARLARDDPPAALATGEEYGDWLIATAALGQGIGPFLPARAPPAAAVVIHAEGGRARYKLHEPNPRRTADIAARHLDRAPLYLRCDGASIAIAPPDGLSDQRLLRPDGRETAVAQVPAGRDAMFRFPLVAPSGAQLAREMASPRYAATPDLLPFLFDEGAARRIGFGRLDALHRVWLLSPDEAQALAAALKGPGQLDAFYRLELHGALGSPPWLGLMVTGKMSRLPTASPVAFRALLHACRIATTPIVVRAETWHDIRPVLADALGHPLACEIYAATAVAVPEAAPVAAACAA